MSPFDAKAATWDEEPRRREMAQALVAAILRHVGLRPGLRLLDIGCGTGLIGLPLASVTGSLLGTDLSPGMLDRFNAKAHAAGLPEVRGELRDLAREPLPPDSIDLAVSAMAFHHIPDTAAMLRAVAGCLAPGGTLAIADLEREDGSFHDDAVPHLGFEPPAMLAAMTLAGLQPVAVETVYHLVKAGRSYPIFLAVARRPDAG
jgi:cyclopropane fatty-acyl-phospholipid synthase-like methyltransferase